MDWGSSVLDGTSQEFRAAAHLLTLLAKLDDARYRCRCSRKDTYHPRPWLRPGFEPILVLLIPMSSLHCLRQTGWSPPQRYSRILIYRSCCLHREKRCPQVIRCYHGAIPSPPESTKLLDPGKHTSRETYQQENCCRRLRAKWREYSQG